jgi:type IV fimbrial biogenesis protein FimT
MQVFAAPAARRHQRGLTLIEMMSVVAVVGVLAGTAVPAFDEYRSRRVLEGTAAVALTDLHFARSEAVSRNQRVRVSYLSSTDGGRCMVIHTGTATDCQCDPGGAPQCQAGVNVLRAHGFGAGAPVRVSANVGSMTIDPVRGMFTLGGRVRVSLPNGNEIQHVVTPAGRIRSCAVGGKLAGYVAC